MRTAKALTLSLYVIIVIAFATLITVNTFTTYAQSSEPTIIHEALVVKIAPPWDTIDDGVKECVINALKEAEDRGEALILEVDSYGGLLDAGMSIGDAIASSRVPVIAYVFDGKAFSAATLIILPAHIIALSPNAAIGDMQPVMYNPTTGEVTFVNESKIVNPVVTKAVGYAKLRGRNTTAVEAFVRKALSMSAEDAVRCHVADFIASDVNDLLNHLKGVEVNTSYGVYRLEIDRLISYQCSIRSRTISVFENPIVSGIMMTVGVLGTLFAILSGKLPVLPLAILFLLLGMLGSGFSPNLVAVTFLVLGAILLAVELFVTPGFGILGISGIVLIALGVALSPVNIPAGTSPPPGYVGELRTMAVSIGAVLGALTGFILYKVLEVKRSKPKTFTPVGVVGRTVDPIGPERPGYIVVEGEYWKAVSDDELPPGTRVRVIAMNDGVLKVEPLEKEGESSSGM